MAWSYDATKTEDALNWVRLRIGDTDTNDQQLSDEEITSLLLLAGGNRFAGATSAAQVISAKYSRYGAQKEAEVYEALAAAISTEGGPGYL